MQPERHTPVQTLIAQCQQLAEQLFQHPVRVHAELIPSLDGDSWRAYVGSFEGTAPTQPLLAACPARGKLRALRELLDALRGQSAPQGVRKA